MPPLDGAVGALESPSPIRVVLILSWDDTPPPTVNDPSDISSVPSMVNVLPLGNARLDLISWVEVLSPPTLE